jgi:hypothetical protein
MNPSLSSALLDGDAEAVDRFVARAATEAPS